MIYLYTGTPGSGKSLHTARIILDALKLRKRPVIANFDINSKTKGYDARFWYIPNGQLTPDFLYDFAREYWQDKAVKEDSITLVLDEAQLLFNSRSWNESTAGASRMDWIEFFSQHRHYGYKVIFACQNDRMIDRQIRSLVEIEVKHRKLANYGWKGLLLSLPFGGKLFATVDYYYGLNEKVGMSFTLPRRKYFRLYDSYNRFKQA